PSSISSFPCTLSPTATSEISSLSLHDALPILGIGRRHHRPDRRRVDRLLLERRRGAEVDDVGSVDRGRLGRGVPPISRRRGRLLDRKSTRLNSSHEWISYAVFCLKKKRHPMDQ